MRETKREKLTPELLSTHLRRTADALLRNLREAFALERKDPTGGGPSEAELLEVLAKAKQLRDNVRGAADEMTVNNPEDHR